MVFCSFIIIVFNIENNKIYEFKRKKLVFSCFLANYKTIFVLES